MLTEQKYQPFDFILLDEYDAGPILYRVYENRIYHVITKEHERLTLEAVKEGYKFLERNGGGKYFNMYEFKEYSEADPEVRTWASKISTQEYTFVDAIIIQNLPQKILADFYLKINRPKHPTSIFTQQQKAIEWIQKQMKLHA